MKNLKDNIGKKGVTRTPMSLTGYITIRGQVYEAISTFYLKINTRVRVTGTSFHLLKVEQAD